MPVALLFLLIFVAVFGATLLGVVAFSKPQARSQVQARLKRVARPGAGMSQRPPRAKTAPLRVLEDRLKPFAVERLSEERMAALQARLLMAGDDHTTPARFVARQWIFAVLLPVVFLLVNGSVLELPQTGVGVGLVLAGVAGYRLPASRLDQAIELRQQAILRQLPTTLDLLTTCVEAGMSLTAAMQKISERMRPHPLREEIEKTLRQMQLGRSRGDALRELGRRVGLKELNSVAIAMVQAETMGASIARTLRIQSGIIREARWQRAQEQAQKAPLKLVFPITFLIFPVIFIIIFGPLVLGILTGKA
ncbi:MAG: type II secretion system F family protein [Candidatus Sericytochromatia bacterium]|nr:type II secretion system F family protein [Candidatus Sericytochromatia bacterium]